MIATFTPLPEVHGLCPNKNIFVVVGVPGEGGFQKGIFYRHDDMIIYSCDEKRACHLQNSKIAADFLIEYFRRNNREAEAREIKLDGSIVVTLF